MGGQFVTQCVGESVSHTFKKNFRYQNKVQTINHSQYLRHQKVMRSLLARFHDPDNCCFNSKHVLRNYSQTRAPYRRMHRASSGTIQYWLKVR